MSATESVRIQPPKTVQFAEMDWFLLNRDELAAAYGDEWLAILGNAVVAHAATPESLQTQLRDFGIERAFITRAHADAWLSVN